MLRLKSAVVVALGVQFAAFAFCRAGGPDVAAAAAEDDATTRLEAALPTVQPLQYLNTPLGDVAMNLSLRLKAPVEVDTAALEAAGRDVDTPITFDATELQLADGLNRMLKSHDLDWTIRDGVLLLTTPDAALEERATKVYSVAESAARPGFRYDELREVLTRMTSPHHWSDVGGMNVLHVGRRLKSAVVTADYRTQLETAQILALVAAPPEGAAQAPPSAGIPLRPRDRIDAALATKTELDVLDTVLEDVTTHLRLRYRISVAVDPTALAGDKPIAQLPATLHVKDTALRPMLNRLTSNLGLDWTVVDGLILITTRDATASLRYAQVRRYDVGDLCAGESFGDDAAELIALLTEVVTPEQWMDVGGETGDVVPFTATKSLFIRHSEHGHHEIAQLLAQLRQAQAVAPTAGAVVDDELSTRFYPIADLDVLARAGGEDAVQASRAGFSEDTAVLVRTLLAEVRPGSWNNKSEGDGPSIMTDRLTRALVIRQTPRGHREVEAFLQKVRGELHVPSPSKNDSAAVERSGGGFY